MWLTHLYIIKGFPGRQCNSCTRFSLGGSAELKSDPMIDIMDLSLYLLCFDRLAEENQVDPVGPSSSWYLWLVKNPVSLG